MAENVNSDNFAVKLVVVTACLVAGCGTALMAWLSFVHLAIPDQLDRITTLALGGALGILAKTSTTTDPQPVQVVNEGQAEAVPVETSKKPGK